MNDQTQAVDARKQRIVDSHLYPVSKVSAGNGQFNIVRLDRLNQFNEPDIISTVSKHYELVTNTQAIKPFVDVFGYNNVQLCYSYHGQKNLFFRIATGRKFTMPQGDTIDETIYVRNSYDKTKSFQFLMGAFRAICSNGLYVGHASIEYKKIHSGNIPIESIIMNALMEYKKNAFELWYKFALKTVTQAEQAKIIEQFKCFDETKEDGSRHFENEHLNRRIRYSASRLIQQPDSLDNQRNLWGLYNQLNRGIAWNITGNSNTDKRIRANRLAETFVNSHL